MGELKETGSGTGLPCQAGIFGSSVPVGSRGESYRARGQGGVEWGVGGGESEAEGWGCWGKGPLCDTIAPSAHFRSDHIPGNAKMQEEMPMYCQMCVCVCVCVYITGTSV